MIPAQFDYTAPESLADAIAALRGDAEEIKVLAGGQSLIPILNMRLAAPEHLIDINDLAELAYIREQDGEIRIGALTRHVDLLRSAFTAGSNVVRPISAASVPCRNSWMPWLSPEAKAGSASCAGHPSGVVT